MDFLHISALRPALPDIESKHIKATVTLIWPYSSSARQFALLLAEPDFRLRRRKGQVRARFSGSSAKAIATTGVGIGDEVVLSLRGAEFMQEGAVSTPGKSIDWELAYTQTIIVQVFRDGNQIANLDAIDMVPTPAPTSPTRRESIGGPRLSAQWSSPAIARLPRLSGGSPFGVELEVGHDAKRRRTSYGRRITWTYSRRPPSPDAEDVDSRDEDLDAGEASPSRPSRLPRTPVSPAKHAPISDTEDDAPEEIIDAIEDEGLVVFRDQTVEQSDVYADAAPSSRLRSELVPDADYDEVHTNLDEVSSSQAQYEFGGDTEVDTEENTELEDTDEPGPNVYSASSTEANTEDHEDQPSYQLVDDETEEASAVSKGEEPAAFAELLEDSDSEVEIVRVQPASSPPAELGGDDANIQASPNVLRGFAGLSSQIAMPPPYLPSLQTDFQILTDSGMLTPIGRGPASPTLQPLDSATLPLPSPFPGEHDVNATSYLDHVATGSQAPVSESLVPSIEAPSADADYIFETSFFNSIGSSKASGSHPDHESVFTPVRFNFGMDGAGWSRPLDLPSSPLQETTEKPELLQPSDLLTDVVETGPALREAEDAVLSSERILAHPVGQSADEPTTHQASNDQPSYPTLISNTIEIPEPNVQHSDNAAASEDDRVNFNQDEVSLASDGVVNKPVIVSEVESEQDADLDELEEVFASGTQQSLAASEIIDLGSPSEDESDDDMSDIIQDSLGPSVIGKEDANTVGAKFAVGDSEFVELDSSSAAVLGNTAKDRVDTQINSWQDTGLESTGLIIEETLTIEEPTSDMIIDEFYSSMPDVPESNDQPRPSSQHSVLEPNDDHSGIKIESIEEDQFSPSVEPSGEMLIKVPDGGHKVGELHTVAVPATGPARNTRSKAKASTSPSKEDVSAGRRTTRSTRSGASAAPVPQQSATPSRKRVLSTASPSRGPTQTSPYSLRSQSTLLSPVNSIFPTGSIRRSPRKHASQQSISGVPDVPLSQVEPYDASLMHFDSLQQPDASQGRYSNVTIVKDSEEESIRSEQSISTAQYSDDWAVSGMQYTNLSDPLEQTTADNEPPHLKPPPASAPQLQTRSRSALRNRQPDQTEVIEFLSSSPGRRLRSAGSIAAASSPRKAEALKQGAPRPQSGFRTFSRDSTPKAVPIAAPSGNETGELGSSPRTVPPQREFDMEDLMRSSPPIVKASVQEQSAVTTNRPLTPDNTQVTNISFQMSQVEHLHERQSTLTPDLTQATSAGLGSFRIDNTFSQETTTMNTGGAQISPPQKSTPRRNVTATDVASRSATPQPKDPSSDAESDKANSLLPAIGLSTPLAYYTPLRDLRFFLNRSSQYVASSNPDFLALVTSATTSPTRAKKGPKHWTTTLHITDASTYPISTTVNIFRAYQNALPTADVGDVILLRSFAVKSLNRKPGLVSDEESSWCVWRYGKPSWGRKRGAFGEVRAREEVKGPEVERGEGEWKEVERIRKWFVGQVRGDMDREMEGLVMGAEG